MNPPMQQRQTGWVGWIYFAAVAMIISGILNIINGLVAVFNDDWVLFDSRETLLLDISGWGWLHILMGIVVLVSGIGITKGHVMARIVAVVGVSISVIANFVFLPAFPFWSIVIIIVDMLILWALIVHGDELDS